MSGIPKEPRQLMVNLMYLVLTAMLALNVSAEIINAFFMVDKGIQKSNYIVGTANENIISAIEKTVDAYPKNKQYEEKSKKAHELAQRFYDYVQVLRDNIIEESGGMDEESNKPVGKKDKEVTTRILVDEGKGLELEKEIIKVRNELLALIDDPTEKAQLSKALALEIDDSYKGSEKDSWAAYNFDHMPVAAVLPMFSKFQNDAKTSETALLNYFAKKAEGTEIKFDSFEPVVSAKKGYVIKGEKYEAQVFLSAYSSQSSSNTRITVNGGSLAVKEGKAKYEVSTSSTGTKKYNVKISVVNPLTKETKSYTGDFEYEVGERSVTVSADKMNVFYVGVDNPVSVVAAGVSSNDLKVNGSGINLAPAGKGKYTVTASKPGNATITVSGGGLPSTQFDFRVKRIPDPIARLGRENSGMLGTGTFKAQGGVGAWLDNFDFEATCKIQTFIMTRVAPRQDAVDAPNSGARFGAAAQRLVDLASPGDTYYFEDIKARCPGDLAARTINSLVFKIK
jgi:gliding motility-associated protein GldM